MDSSKVFRKFLSSSEKKRKRKAIETLRTKGRINIGTSIDKWRLLKAKEKCRTDADFAKLLLNVYDAGQTPTDETPQAVTDTPDVKYDSPEKLEKISIIEDMDTTFIIDSHVSQLPSRSIQETPPCVTIPVAALPGLDPERSVLFDEPSTSKVVPASSFMKPLPSLLRRSEPMSGATIISSSQGEMTELSGIHSMPESDVPMMGQYGKSQAEMKKPSGVQSLQESESDIPVMERHRKRSYARDARVNLTLLKEAAVYSSADEDESEASHIEEIEIADIDQPTKDIPVLSDVMYETETGVTDSETDYEPTPKKMKLYQPADVEIVQVLTDAEGTNVGKIHFVYEDNLKELAKLEMIQKCSRPGCNLPYHLDIETRGTATYITWVCSNNHAKTTWVSQPRFAHGIHLGDVQMSSAILMSGNNLDKVQLMCQFLDAPSVQSDLFLGLQRHFIVPAIEEMWEATLDRTLAKYKNQEVIVCGDGRNDSPGHCAQYCTYTMMHHETLDILCMVIVDKRRTGGKSPNMEAYAFKKAMRKLLDKGLKVTEVVTDQHLTIQSIMKKDYGSGPHPIRHSFDIWHVSKNLLKKLSKAASSKNCKDLLKWVPDIVRHFWWVSQHCQTDIVLFKEMWRGVLHHVTGVHEWVAVDGSFIKCQHDADFEERTGDLLKPSSPAMKALQNVILNARFLRHVPYYIRFRRTSELETFNDLIIKYCAKRYAFTPPVYAARNYLAGLDYMANKDRADAVTKQGETRFARRYNKKTKRWAVTKVKVAKQYSHIKDVMTDVIQRKIKERGSARRSKELSADDPRKIKRTLATDQPPSTKDIWEGLRSRYKSETTVPDVTTDPDSDKSE